MNAFNMELSATERFANTIDYASMNVQEEKIVRNSKEIDDFFLN